MSIVQKIINAVAKFFKINQKKKKNTTDDIYPMW